jgi:uncharacterized protein
MNRNLKLLLVFFLFVQLYTAQAQLVKFPLQKGFINDYEGLFTPSQQNELNTLMAEFEQKTNREIVIITLNDIKPYKNVGDYSKDLSYNWSITKDEVKNGLLVIVSKTLKSVRIITAFGTHQLIRDDVCKKIIDREMIPLYTIGNYFAGTKQGLLSLMKEWN